ncbi:hypothetical protein [Streptomyces niphimycinicus]|uniref:hypothetical protein n=1 Tax=Streptomyces niphimycinicus TaxID=2842201 RepID=UPI00209A85A3|nr:hypothetical protein [Streptomyces niphimycinicus]
MLAATLVACGGSDGDSGSAGATKSAGSSGAAASGGQQTPDATPSSTMPGSAWKITAVTYQMDSLLQTNGEHTGRWPLLS